MILLILPEMEMLSDIVPSGWNVRIVLQFLEVSMLNRTDPSCLSGTLPLFRTHPHIIKVNADMAASVFLIMLSFSQI